MMRRFVLSLIISLIPVVASAQVYIIRPYTSGSGVSCAGLVTPNTYGSATVIPVLTIDANGCISVITTATPFAKGTLTASNPFTFTQTWNNAAELFTGFTFDITANSFSGASEIFAIKVNGVTRLGLGYGPGSLQHGDYLDVGASGIRWSRYNDPSNLGLHIRSNPDNNAMEFNNYPISIYDFKAQDSVSGRIRMFTNATAFYGGFDYTLATGAVCITSTGDCRLNHNTTSGAWESSIPLAGTKVGGMSTAAPTISGDATLVTGSTDIQGKITSTVTAAGSAVLTFGVAYLVAPSCFANNETAGAYSNAISTTTTVTISGTWTTSDKIVYSCIGR